jgi:hypothetical protein
LNLRAWSSCLLSAGITGIYPHTHLKTVLKSCLGYRATHGIKGGFDGWDFAAQLLPLSNPNSFFSNKYWSWNHHSISFPYSNLHLMVCSWGNPPWDSKTF